MNFFDAPIAGIKSVTTDPRDSIYALQRISSAAESDDMIPDYNSALQTPFLQTAKYLLRQEHPSRILHLAGIGFYRNREVQASWVPDWSTPRLSAMYWRDPTASPYLSSVTADEKPSMVLGPEGLTLIITCIKVDCIQQLGPHSFGVSENGVSKPSRFPSDYPNMVDSRDIALGNATNEPYPTGIPRIEGFWRMLIGDKASNDTWPASETLFENYQALERFIGYMSKCGPDMDLKSHNLSLEAQNLLEISIPRDTLESGRFENLAGPHTQERRFGVTEGGYMGMVPQYPETGDLVYVIPGTQVPFLLRRRRATIAQRHGAKRDGILLGRATFTA